ncbi:AAA-ATPase_like domain-containing protein [Alphaproteobacteria bacterium]
MKFPIGISNFRKLISKVNIYLLTRVDKDIIEDSVDMILITRLRRILQREKNFFLSGLMFFSSPAIE